MSVNEIETFVLLFPNEEWSSTSKDVRSQGDVLQLRPNVSFYQSIESNLQTLSSRNANRDGTISGFLYVPDINKKDDCYELSKEYIPANVTRQANLPPTDFTLIALAPWINSECTLAWMKASRQDPARAFLFYLPDNNTTQPPSPSSDVWDLSDGDAWKTTYQYPVYAIPGSLGAELMRNLAKYSGNMTSVPYGHQLTELPNIDPRDYVRMYTQLSILNSSTLPSLWVFFIIVVAILVLILGMTSATMQLLQRARRHSLEQRVLSGEVNLEALGIKRIPVSQEVLDSLPLFTYSAESETTPPTSPHIPEDGDSSIEDDDKTFDGRSSPTSTKLLPIPKDLEIPPELVLVEDTITETTSVLVHKFLPYSQPNCSICLEDFVSGISEIRELPCGHIFHPDCIDMYLMNNSSLCLLCKKSALPLGYCPLKITNAMVRRERNIRRLRSRVTFEPDVRDPESHAIRPRLAGFGASIKKHVFSRKDDIKPLPHTPQAVLMSYPTLQRPEIEQNSAFGSDEARADFVELRLREIAARQFPIQDPDVCQDQQGPRWRRTLLRAFPGF